MLDFGDMSETARNREPAKCRNCGQSEDWHSAIDGACSDSEEPHVDAEPESESDNEAR